MANLNRGEPAIIEAEGPDAEAAVKRLAELTREFGQKDLKSKGDTIQTIEEDF
jgi:hypothetical protein